MRYATLITLLAMLIAVACSSRSAYPPTERPPVVDPGPAPGGGSLGIPYRACTKDSECTSTELINSGIDSKGDLEFEQGCQTLFCRAHYRAGKVCLTGDTIVCGKGTGGVTEGTSTCQKSGWGPCT